MIARLFSAFDFRTKAIMLSFLTPILGVCLLIPNIYLLNSRKFYSVGASLSALLKANIDSTLSPRVFQGYHKVFVTVFIAILLSNMLGITPYSFTSTSHLSVSLILSLTFWRRYILITICIEVVVLFVFIQLCLTLASSNSISIYIICLFVISASGAAIGLSLLVSLSRSHGEDYVKIISVLW